MIIVLTALMAETYPALYLSALNPAKGFKGDHLSSKKGHLLRKVLIVMQFSLSIGLIIATSVIYRQISYMKNTTPGFNDEGLIYLPVRENSVKYFQPFKESFLQYPDIISVAYKDFLPTDDGHAVMSTQQESSPSLDWEGRNKNEVKLEFNIVDFDYFKTMGMKVIEGRNFSKDFESDENEAFILNEEAVNQMQMKDPIGRWIKMNELKGKIVGVVKNAHFGSLQYKTSPQVFFLLTKQKFADPNGSGILFIKIKENRITKTLANIKEQWEKVAPGNPFEFHFLNETIDNLYRGEMKINTIFNYFTLFAIFISCLGLFGLSSFIIEQKRKEIGVRKVLGASIFGIVAMLTKSYTKWILAANIIAWPAAYYVMNKWLQNYEYHISIGLWVFVFAGITALFISLVTVSVQAVKAAASNPVNSLRNE